MWDETRWASVKDEKVHEAARQWTLAGYLAAVETFRRAAAAAVPGEVVLLSPACASFDQFRDYEARGDSFRQIVEALTAPEPTRVGSKG